MKKFLLIIILSLNYSCSQNNSILLKYNPKKSEKSIYWTEFDLDNFKIYTHISKKAIIEKDTIIYYYRNDSIKNHYDGVISDVAVDTTSYVLKSNITGDFYYNNEDDFIRELAHVNYNLYQIEFPKNEIKIGDKWHGKRVVNDMIFKKLLTKYEFLKELPENKVLIGIEFVFDELKDKKFKLSQNFSKKMIGEYIIDKNTGEVINAVISVSGNSGFGEVSKGMRITINKM